MLADERLKGKFPFERWKVTDMKIVGQLYAAFGPFAYGLQDLVRGTVAGLDPTVHEAGEIGASVLTGKDQSPIQFGFPGRVQ